MNTFLLVVASAIGAALWLSPGVAVADKPSPPVRLVVTTAPVAGGYEVVVTATPTRATTTVALAAAGTRKSFGATAAGQARELRVRVAVRAGSGVDVMSTVAIDGQNLAKQIRLGAPAVAAPKPLDTHTLPTGRVVAEGR